ncbi:hypothetical protein Tco_1224956, partial [Tanacetum coccineum]
MLPRFGGVTAKIYINEIIARNGILVACLWAEIEESSLIRPELVQETTDKVVLIKEKLKAPRDCQKSYADNRRKPLEFEIEVDKTLRFVEEPIENSDREVMRLKCSRMVIVKVRFWLEAKSLRLQ